MPSLGQMNSELSLIDSFFDERLYLWCISVCTPTVQGGLSAPSLRWLVPSRLPSFSLFTTSSHWKRCGTKEMGSPQPSPLPPFCTPTFDELARMMFVSTLWFLAWGWSVKMSQRWRPVATTRTSTRDPNHSAVPRVCWRTLSPCVSACCWLSGSMEMGWWVATQLN